MEQKNSDQMEVLDCGALIQHGPFNDRIYLMKTAEKSSTELPKQLIAQAKKYGYSKIFAKVPKADADDFIKLEFQIEASIPKFYNGTDTALFLAYYLDEKRSYEPDLKLYENNMALAVNRGETPIPDLDSSKFKLRECDNNDVKPMAEIYKTVFLSYPFPIHSADFLLETMNSHVEYFCIEADGEIVALASAEKDDQSSSWEMTDFATLPKWRGNGLGVQLLEFMGREAKQRGIKTVYTIARAASPGMNITFAKMGYHFGGRLKNNTNISGKIESMNVWYKYPTES
ncbi:MAG: putative beta-lysine N-acetyltransferase [Victivallaceae bacterium]|nr:putative beta-lysine N-acetyltransferase [Victivallaceae bacterium]MDD4181044.1 putative beta-lysine N-acetyltransferase [Victivallaceae bacterium]